MHDQKPLCAWVSRHPPTPDQRIDLAAFTIRQINERQPDGDAIWSSIVAECGSAAPDLIMLVTAWDRIPGVVRYLAACAPRTPIIRPLMLKSSSGRWEWTGEWERYYFDPRHRRRDIFRESWTPESRVQQ